MIKLNRFCKNISGYLRRQVMFVEDKEELDYFRSAACRSISKIQKSQKK
jgi:hypothetical protein